MSWSYIESSLECLRVINVRLTGKQLWEILHIVISTEKSYLDF
jgi:hypothetical protein